MAKPGIAHLGHSPKSKVKLEGPKVHHDDHGKHDSVPGKGNKNVSSGEHWEMKYNVTAPSRNMIDVEGSDFNPKVSTLRKTTHLKVNREDH